MAIPRVRLTYVQGLAPVHEDLQRPREVDLITDGEALIVCPPATRRPLARLPIAAIQDTAVAPHVGPASERSKGAGGLSGSEDAIVLRVGSGRGVPAAVAGQPLVFVDPQGHAEEKLRAVRSVLTPRSADEMARLEKGEQLRGRLYAYGFIGAIVLVLAVAIPVFLLFFGPRQRGQTAPLPPAPAVAMFSQQEHAGAGLGDQVIRTDA